MSTELRGGGSTHTARLDFRRDKNHKKEELTSGGDMFWSTYSKSNYSGRQTGKTRM